MLIFTLGAVEMDISFWVLFIQSNIQLDGSLDELAVSGGSMFSMTVGEGSVNFITWHIVWHKESSSNDSWVSPALASFRVDLVVDGDISFTKTGLLECSPDTWLSSGGEISWVFWTALGFTALFVWPTVTLSFLLLSLRSVSQAGDLDSSSIGWTRWSFLSCLLLFTPDNIDGALVGWLVDSLIVKEILDLGSNGVDVNTDNTRPSGGFVTGGSLDLNINLFNTSGLEGDSSIKILGFWNSSNVLGVKGSLSLDTETEFFLGISFILDLDLSLKLVIDRLGGRILLEVSLQSASLSWWGKEQSLEKVASTKTDLSEGSTQTSTNVLVLRSKELSEGAQDVDTAVDLLTVKIFDSSLDSFHEFVLVSRSKLTGLTVLLTLGDLGNTQASWASLVKEVNNFAVVEGSWGVIEDSGDGRSVNLGDNWVFFSWGVDDKVDGLLLNIKTNAHLTWDTDSEGADSTDRVSTAESWEMVVDRRLTVEVELETNVVVPGQGGSSLLRGDGGVKSSGGGYSADDGNGGSEFIGLLNGGSTNEQHAVDFLVVSCVPVLAQLLDEVGDGGNSLGISSVVSNNAVVKEDSDFNSEWLSLTFLNSNLGEDILKVIKVNNTSGHGHDSGRKSLANSLKTEEERKVVGSISSGLTIESEVDRSWNNR